MKKAIGYARVSTLTQRNNETIKEQVKQYIADNFMFSDNGFQLSDDASFLEEGIVD